MQLNDNEQIKLFLKRLLVNKYMLFKCAICGALFFDLKELRAHFQHSLQVELDKLNLENPNKSAALNRRIQYRYLKQKYAHAFNKKGFKWIDDKEPETGVFADLLNNFSFKKVKFSFVRLFFLYHFNL